MSYLENKKESTAATVADRFPLKSFLGRKEGMRNSLPQSRPAGLSGTITGRLKL